MVKEKSAFMASYAGSKLSRFIIHQQQACPVAITNINIVS